MFFPLWEKSGESLLQFMRTRAAIKDILFPKYRPGPGRQTVLGIHRRIEKKRLANVARAAAGRWCN